MKQLLTLLLLIMATSVNSKTKSNLTHQGDSQNCQEYFKVLIDIKYIDIKKNATKEINVEVQKISEPVGCPLNLLGKKGDYFFGRNDYEFKSTGNILEEINLSEGYYAIIINDILDYKVFIEKAENIVIETFPSVSNPKVFGRWECKKWHGTYGVSLNPTEEKSTNFSVGSLSWFDGCNWCGNFEFLVVSKTKIKILNPNNPVWCTLLSCNRKKGFWIPGVEWVTFKKKRKKLILKFHKKSSTKKVVLRYKKPDK